MSDAPYCIACRRALAPDEHDVHRARLCAGVVTWLCGACWAKCLRGDRTPRQTMEAVMLWHGDEFGGPDCDADHEDYRDLELLGLIDHD